jgi:hypothetical protein
VFVRVGAIDVIESDSDLRHDLQAPLPCVEHLRINRIAQCGDQPINAAFHFFNDQFLRRRLGSLEHLEVVTARAQKVLRCVSDARCNKHAEAFLFGHTCRGM